MSVPDCQNGKDLVMEQSLGNLLEAQLMLLTIGFGHLLYLD